MLTPSFDIKQDDDFVIVTLRVPYVKIAEAEFHINGCDFKFYCKPYFLRLHLPGEVVEDGREKAVFDVEKGSMIVHLPKSQHGEHFENLDMLTTLLSKNPSKHMKDNPGKPLIEVAGEVEARSSESEDEFDWQMEQQLPEDEPQPSLSTPSTLQFFTYGFASQHGGVFAKLQEEIPSIVDCLDPDHMTSHERRMGRIAHEEISFDPDHYLADLMDNESIDGLLKFRPSWKDEMDKWRKTKHEAFKQSKPSEPGQDIVSFTQTERYKLKDLPNKEYLLDKATKRCLYLGLIDIMFAFAYDHRATEGEGNVESAWTICKLSPTLSWLEVYRGSVHDVVHSCLRRSLCYPLYRHWQLSLSILQDIRDIFRLGRRKLLQCLLSVCDSLNSSDPYYILNNLYITDYCVWIQRASTKQILALSDDLDEITVSKASIGWELDDLEEAARLVLENDTQSTCSSSSCETESDESTSVYSSDDEQPRQKSASLIMSEGITAETINSSTSIDPTLSTVQLLNDTKCGIDCPVNIYTSKTPNKDSCIEKESKTEESISHDSKQSSTKRETISTLSLEPTDELTLISPKVGNDCQPGVLEQLLNLNIDDTEEQST